MTKIIVVTSGKGGVGKTTTSASIATGLALRGHKTAVIDFDVGLRNLDLIMGCERRVVYDLVNVIQGEATLTQALIKDKNCENLFILPASQTRDKDALTREGVEKVMQELSSDKMGFEYIICDSPAGIEQGALMALYFADEAIVTTNPEVSSVRDSDRILGILQSKSRKAEQGGTVKEHLLITRYSPERVNKGEMLSVQDICASRSSASFPNRKTSCKRPMPANPSSTKTARLPQKPTKTSLRASWVKTVKCVSSKPRKKASSNGCSEAKSCH